ncbi:MAG: PilZ domain [Acidimicrobiia bacterium]|nr:PilZ domain [Acidimicrobiia bacterium]
MAAEAVEERRAHPRFVVSFEARCRRLGPRRMHADQMVSVLDLSFGGMRIEAPPWMDVGNVVEIEKDDIAIRGLVVGVSGRNDGPGQRTSLGPQAHIAFSNVSPECHWALAQLLQDEAASG